MPTADEYRSRARELFEMAKRETDLEMKAQLERIAPAYVDLAERVDKKANPQQG
jgi:hypothetical protein